MILLIVIVVIIIVIALLRFSPLNGGEDNWIKDEKGIYIKHGNPSEIPDDVEEQETAIKCAIDLFSKFITTKTEINSQCLGTCQDFAVDIVHVPRNAEDDLIENQCEQFRNKLVSHFIELNKNGGIVRVV